MRPKSKRGRQRVGGVVGAAVGMTAAFGVGKLIGFENFWLGAALIVVCTGLGGFLGQKLAGRE